MEEVIKSLNIRNKFLARRSRAMRDITLASEYPTKSLAGIIKRTKSVRLQTDQKDESNPEWSAIIYFARPLVFFFSKFGDVASVSAVKSNAGIATEDTEVMVSRMYQCVKAVPSTL